MVRQRPLGDRGARLPKRGPGGTALADLASAPIDDGLRTTLELLGALAEGKPVDPADVRVVLSAGVSPQQVADALAVAFALNTTSRLANAFASLSPDELEAGARYLLRRGYR